MIRYKKLGYVALNVSDVEQSSEFYRDIVGMDLHPRTNAHDPAFLRCSNDHHNMILYPDGEPGIKRVAFEMEDEENLDKAFELLTKAGLNPKEIDESERQMLLQGRTFRFIEPNIGITIELFSDMMQMGKKYEYRATKIAKLGHVVFEVEKFDEVLKFFLDTMNFKVSDVSGHEIGWAWLRCFPNPLHHSLGLVRGTENKMNHIAFNVVDFDDIGIARVRLKKNDVPIVFGPGRHAPSGSVFLYFLDPDNLTLEYSQGMEEFPESGARKPRRLEPTLETLDMWGGTPDPRFGQTGKIVL